MSLSAAPILVSRESISPSAVSTLPSSVVKSAAAALEVSVGWTWSSLAHLAELPTAAVPSIRGSAVAATGTAAWVI